HVYIFKCAPQAIMYHSIDYFIVTHTVARARFGKQIGSVAHTLHTACNEYLLIACANGLRRKHHGFEARATDLIDSECGDIVRQTCRDGGRGGRSRANTRRDDIAHDDFFNGIGRYTRTTYSFLYSDSPQLGCCKTGKVAKKFAGRRSGRSDDDSI